VWLPEPVHGATREPNPYVSVAGQLIKAGGVEATEVDPSVVDRGIADAIKKSLQQDTVGTVFFTDPLLSDTIAVSVSQEFCLALSGTIQVFCVRQPTAYAKWQQETYDAIMTAYTKLKMDYDRARAETSVGTLSVTSGDNPLENTTIISTEMKKASIAFMTGQNFEKFGTITANGTDKIPEVQATDMQKAIDQGSYADFFEKAFEWENMTYLLYPYFWGRRSTWRQRIGFQSPDPAFSDFVKAGMTKVTVPARIGFGLEVIHMLESGKIWEAGPVSTLVTSPYYGMAQEILEAESKPTEVKVSKPWYTVIPTDLVQLRHDAVLPRFKLDNNGVWVERAPGEPDD
jgi:hypothetical protein